MGDDEAEQRKIIDRAGRLYAVRSELPHGDKLETSEEAAAISLVDHWTPEAENLARGCLKRIIQRNLTKTFDNRKAHEALLTNLLLASNLDEISAAGASSPPQPKSSLQAKSTMKQCSGERNPSHERGRNV